jgi:hypothetical protein
MIWLFRLQQLWTAELRKQQNVAAMVSNNRLAISV